MPPLTLEELWEVEAADKRRIRDMRNGHWQAFSVVRPAVRVEGPADVPLCELVEDESTTLQVLAHKFRPSRNTVVWVTAVTAYEEPHVKEGQREHSQLLP